MKLPAIRRLVSNTIEDIQRSVIDITEIINRIVKDPYLSRKIIKDVPIGTSNTTIAHSLGYVPQHFAVTQKFAANDVWQVGTATTTTIILRATAAADVTVEVW